MNYRNFADVVKQILFFFERTFGWLFFVREETEDPFLLVPIYNAAFPHG